MMNQHQKYQNLLKMLNKTFEENVESNEWCTRNIRMYDLHTTKFKQTLIRFIFSDGYKLSLGIKNLESGQWLDNENGMMRLKNLNGNIFDNGKINDIAIKKGSVSLENMSLRMTEIPTATKIAILDIITKT